MLLAIFEFIIIFILGYGLYNKSTAKICRSKKGLNGKTCIVAGGTSGIGLEVAIDFAMRGARVIVTGPIEEEGRKAQKTIIEESGNNDVVFKLVDYASFGAVRQFASDILKTEKRLDILMNNAGTTLLKPKTEDGFDFIMQVNYLSHFLLTMLLLPLLISSGAPSSPSRIVNTSSIWHRRPRLTIKEALSPSLNADMSCPLNEVNRRYPTSKLYLMLFAHELTKKLKSSNVVINSIDPGAVFTTIHRSSLGMTLATFLHLTMWLVGTSPYVGAQTLIYAAVDKKAGKEGGKFYANCEPCKPSKASLDDNLANELWETTLPIVKLTDENLKFLL